MAEELAKAASSDTMLRNLTLTGVSTLQDGCLEIYRRRTRLQSALVDQCMFFTQFVAKTTQAITPKTEVRVCPLPIWCQRARKRSCSRHRHTTVLCAQRPRFLIGIIGCGLVGRQLVDTLLERGAECCLASVLVVPGAAGSPVNGSRFAGYPPEDIAISTRSPHTLTHLTDMGIRVAHDNALVRRAMHIGTVMQLRVSMGDAVGPCTGIESKPPAFHSVPACAAAHSCSIHEGPRAPPMLDCIHRPRR